MGSNQVLKHDFLLQPEMTSDTGTFLWGLADVNAGPPGDAQWERPTCHNSYAPRPALFSHLQVCVSLRCTLFQEWNQEFLYQLSMGGQPLITVVTISSVNHLSINYRDLQIAISFEEKIQQVFFMLPFQTHPMPNVFILCWSILEAI